MRTDEELAAELVLYGKVQFPPEEFPWTMDTHDLTEQMLRSDRIEDLAAAMSFPEARRILGLGEYIVLDFVVHCLDGDGAAIDFRVYQLEA